MFVMIELDDHLSVSSAFLCKDSTMRIEDSLRALVDIQVVNKIIPGAGIAICCIEDPEPKSQVASLEPNSTGHISIDLIYKLVVFRPIPGEVVTGTITSCVLFENILLDSTGIQVDLVGFRVGFISKENMQESAYYHVGGNAWIWRFEDPDEPVMARVIKIEFPENAMIVQLSTNGPGLGLTKWWE